MLGHDDQAAPGLGHLNDAADSAKDGDVTASIDHGEKAEQAFNSVAEKAKDEATKDAYKAAANQTKQVVQDVKNSHGVGDKPVPFAQLPPAVKEALESVANQAKQQAKSAVPLPGPDAQSLKKYISGEKILSPKEVQRFLARQAKQRVTPSIVQ